MATQYTDYVGTAKGLLAQLQALGIAPDNIRPDTLTRAYMDDTLRECLNNALEEANRILELANAASREMNQLYYDLHFTPDCLVTDLAIFPEKQWPLVEEYNRLVAKGLENTMTPAELDRFVELTEELEL